MTSPSILLNRAKLNHKFNDLLSFEITYLSQGLSVKGLLMMPKTSYPPLPGLMYCRGGIRRVGMVKPERIAGFAQRGYAVFAPYYRGNEGGEGREDFCGEDRHDVFSALQLMQELPEIRPGQIPLIGFSRGAVMALLAAKDNSLAGSVVVWGGVSDMLLTYEERVDLRRMLKRVVGHPKKKEAVYWERSPVRWSDQLQREVLIIHGSEDQLVSPEHALRLAAALEQAGKPYTMKLLDGYGHHLPPQKDKQVLDEIIHWIEERHS